MSVQDRIDCNLLQVTVQAVQEGLLSPASRAYGITQQVICGGFHSLSRTQQTVYLSQAVPALNEMVRRRRSLVTGR
jgi:hypothetical protein